MISREDFVFAIGYDGAVAVVDGKAKKQYGRLSTMELAAAGLYRAAFASALYSDKESEMSEFLAFFNEKAKSNFGGISDLQRLFGVNKEKIDKVLVL